NAISGHSMQLRAMTMTRSPGIRPRLRTKLARRRARSSTWDQVCTRPASTRARLCGYRRALLVEMSPTRSMGASDEEGQGVDRSAGVDQVDDLADEPEPVVGAPQGVDHPACPEALPHPILEQGEIRLDGHRVGVLLDDLAVGDDPAHHRRRHL